MEEQEDKKKPPLNNYLRYSGLGFQIAGSVGLGVLIGYGLDKWLKTSGPYFTLAFSVVFMVAGLYLGLRDFMKK